MTVTPILDIQTEYRFQDREQGDLRLNFDPEDFLDNDRQSFTEESGRFGMHLQLSPRSDILVSALYGDIESKQLVLEEVFNTNFVDEGFQNQTGYQLDTQYLFRTTHATLILGGSLYHTEVDRRNRTIVDGRASPLSFSQSFSRDQTVGYIYGYLDWPAGFYWTLGLSYDYFVERDTEIGDALNPKVGLQWDITNRVRLRLAYTETSRRSVLIQQALEPTEITGFNQFFDDPLGSESLRYGIGIDTRPSDRLYGGFEISRRDITAPLVTSTTRFAP